MATYACGREAKKGDTIRRVHYTLAHLSSAKAAFIMSKPEHEVEKVQGTMLTLAGQGSSLGYYNTEHFTLVRRAPVHKYPRRWTSTVPEYNKYVEQAYDGAPCVLVSNSGVKLSADSFETFIRDIRGRAEIFDHHSPFQVGQWVKHVNSDRWGKVIEVIPGRNDEGELVFSAKVECPLRTKKPKQPVWIEKHIEQVSSEDPFKTDVFVSREWSDVNEWFKSRVLMHNGPGSPAPTPKPEHCSPAGPSPYNAADIKKAEVEHVELPTVTITDTFRYPDGSFGYVVDCSGLEVDQSAKVADLTKKLADAEQKVDLWRKRAIDAYDSIRNLDTEQELGSIAGLLGLKWDDWGEGRGWIAPGEVLKAVRELRERCPH